MNRKINLPDYCCPFTGHGSVALHPDCKHDYPPESKKEHDTYVSWTCSKCKGKRCYEVYE